MRFFFFGRTTVDDIIGNVGKVVNELQDIVDTRNDDNAVALNQLQALNNFVATNNSEIDRAQRLSEKLEEFLV